VSASRTCQFFNTPERRDEFAKAAMRWHGTPFVPHAAVMGAGVDCVNLGREAYRVCGLVFAQALPGYTMDGGKHNPESQLVEWLVASGRFANIWDRSCLSTINSQPSTLVQPGDTLCFKIGLSAHHAGFVIGGTQFVHCLFKREVMLGDLRDKTFVRWLHSIWRPLEQSNNPRIQQSTPEVLV
jgi:cell wall-associated NlpC family hydrolase